MRRIRLPRLGDYMSWDTGFLWPLVSSFGSAARRSLGRASSPRPMRRLPSSHAPSLAAGRPECGYWYSRPAGGLSLLACSAPAGRGQNIGRPECYPAGVSRKQHIRRHEPRLAAQPPCVPATISPLPLPSSSPTILLLLPRREASLRPLTIPLSSLLTPLLLPCSPSSPALTTRPPI
jgi:hypothetical protein